MTTVFGLTEIELGLTTVELAVTVLATATAVVGIYIAYLAYLGLRRYDSKPMLYLSVGMILLFGVTYATASAGTILLRLRILPLPYQDMFRIGVRVLQLTGLLLIAYSLRIRR